MTNAIGAAPAANTPPSGLFGQTGADFNMFLKLLTTQMQNQDPLDPMDTSQYTQQLVQYSQVEQSIQQTGVLRDILGRLSTQDMAQASGFIGREVEFASSQSGLSATAPASWAFDLPRAARSMTATVTDTQGRTVATRTLDGAAGANRFAWDGILAGGGRAADGAYTLSIAAVDGNGATIPVAVRSVGRVAEVTSSGGVLALGVNGIALPASSIVRVAASG